MAAHGYGFLLGVMIEKWWFLYNLVYILKTTQLFKRVNLSCYGAAMGLLKVSKDKSLMFTKKRVRTRIHTKRRRGAEQCPCSAEKGSSQGLSPISL